MSGLMPNPVTKQDLNYIPANAVTRQVPEELAGQRLDQALARMFPEHSRNRLAGWLRSGQIRIDARAARPAQRIRGGEEISVAAPAGPQSASSSAEAIELAIVFEDECVIVLDKPAGLVVHPGSGNWGGTLLNALLHHHEPLAGIPRAGIVHRLDKDTSGLMMVAKTLAAQTCLVRQLQARSVQRIYQALVHGRVERDGEIDAPIGRDPRQRTRMAVTARGREARTAYRVLRRFDFLTLLECRLSTGRTHQIRVHLDSIGHPLVGDPVYRRRARHSAAGAAARFPRQALHAVRLSFVHPASARAMQFDSALPGDLRELISSLE